MWHRGRELSAARIQFHDLRPTVEEFAAAVAAGLSSRPRSIPPKYFYDARGSQLFDAITATPEYYPTRTEIALLEGNAAAIARRVGTGSLLVEPGGGSCAKVHILLQGLQPCAYVPMDISRDHLWLAAQELAAQYPWLEIHAACTDFVRHMAIPDTAPEGPRVAFFPGSSIGNFDPSGAVEFLATIAEVVGAGGFLLIGVDLKKDRPTLEAAYNDAAGITAAFNLNLLSRIKRELRADIALDAWRHKAFYNEPLGRIEMHLESRTVQTVRVGDQRFEFTAGETIHTENSYKYGVEEFQQLAAEAGFRTEEVWVDDGRLFSVQLLSVPD